MSIANPWPVGSKLLPRIVGGKKADIQNHPWLVSLRESGHHKCGAVLIKQDKALTGAHCYDIDIAARDYSVFAGSSSRTRNGELAHVGRIYQHPEYNEEKMINDIAVVWLLKKLPIGESIKPIAMAWPNIKLPMVNLFFMKPEAVVAGWGLRGKNGGFSEDLYEITVPVVISDECAKIFGKHIDINKVICAGNMNGADVEYGDSGGALVYKSKLYGIVSWELGGVNGKRISLFTRIAAYRSWIDLAITDKYM